MHTPFRSDRLSKAMELPNGEVRVIQYHPRTLNAGWVVQRGKKQVRIAGTYFKQGDRHLFLPNYTEDRNWIMKEFKAKRERGDYPQTKEEMDAHVLRQQEKAREARWAMDEKFGAYFNYKGRNRRMYYTRVTKPYGYMMVDREKVWGYIYNGKFVRVKNDLRWQRKLSD